MQNKSSLRTLQLHCMIPVLLLWLTPVAQTSPMWQIPITHETDSGVDQIQIRLGGNDEFYDPASTNYFFIDDDDVFVDEGLQWEQKFLNGAANLSVSQGPDLGAGTLSFNINVLGEYETHQPAFHYQAYKNGQLVANNDFYAVGPENEDWDAYAGTWQQDSPLWQEFLPGDANKDGVVDFDDFVTWQTNYTGREGDGKFWESGDWTGDSSVDFDDFVAWQTNYTGRIGPPPLNERNDLDSMTATVSTVPEPSADLLLLLGVVFSLANRRLNLRWKK